MMRSIVEEESCPPPAPSRIPETESVDERKVLFMFFSFPQGPIAYRLYAVKVPNLSSSTNNYDPDRETRDITPVIEFQSGKYPDSMICAELDSKLYFLGGTVGRYGYLTGIPPQFPHDVYALDTSRISMDTTTSSDLLLEGVPPMKSGKENAFAVVAHGKIYVMGSPQHMYSPANISRFEVFEPVPNHWCSLPDPPIETRIGGYSVFDKKIFFVSWDNTLFSFDVDTLQWVEYSEPLPYDVFLGKAEFAGDTLYACSGQDLAPVAYRITSRGIDESLFDDPMHLSREMKAVYDFVPLPDQDRSVCLVHLGNRFFCYVCTFCLRGADGSGNMQIRLAFFQARKETYANSYGGTYFEARFVDFIKFVSKTGEFGRGSCSSPYCFPISSGKV